jgi:IclR family acetate operon transcriptional repressor
MQNADQPRSGHLRSQAPIQSLDRGLRILLAVGESKQPVSLGWLTALLGVDRSSVHRLARTLCHRGLLRQTPEKTYVLGSTVCWLAAQLRQHGSLVEIARPQLIALAEQTGETAHLAVRDGRHVLFIDHRLTAHTLGVAIQSGRVEPVHCTALGKALVMDMDAAQLAKELGAGPFDEGTSRALRTPDALANGIRQASRDGVTFDDQEYQKGVRCLAAPIRELGGAIVAAIGISAPANRLIPQRVVEATRLVKSTAQRVSRELGHMEETVP